MLADWSAIWTAFAVVWSVLAIYGVSLFWRLKRAGDRGPIDDPVETGRRG
jgi:hypothetical protein